MIVKTAPSSSGIRGQSETSTVVGMSKRINIVHGAKSLFNHFERWRAAGIFFSEKDRAVQMKQIFSYTIDIALHDDHRLCPEFRLRSSPIGVYRYVEWPYSHFIGTTETSRRHFDLESFANSLEKTDISHCSRVINLWDMVFGWLNSESIV